MDIFKIVGKIALDGQEDFEKGANNAKKIGEDLSKSIGKGLATVGKVGAAALGVASAAMVALGTAGLNAYAQYEQLAGGMQKIFGDMDTSKIMNDASEAYKNLGMSASDYLAIVNDVGASFSSTMGSDAGYEAAKKGLTAISDYATGTGKDFDVLQDKLAMITRSTSSYQSIADQFSGILPATSAGFLKQAQAAGFLSTKYKDLSKVPINEYQQAVVDMLALGVDGLNLTGNTAAEASETISGSLEMTKAAWHNLIVGFADSDQDLDRLVRNFVSSVTTAARNIVPRLVQIFHGISEALPEVIAVIAEELPELLGELLPGIISGAGALITGLIDALPELLVVLWEALKQIVGGVWNYIFGEGGLLGLDYDFGTAFEDMKQAASNAWNAIGKLWKTIGKPVWDTIVSCVETAKKAFEDNLPEMENFFKDFCGDIEEYWEEHLEPCLEAIGKFIEEDLGPAFEEVFGRVIPPLVSSCFNGIKNMWEQVLLPTLTGITDFLTGVFSEDWGLAWDGLSTAVIGFSSVGQVQTSTFAQFLSGVFAPELEWLQQKFDELSQKFNEKIEPMKQKWEEFTEGIGEKLESAVSTVTTKFNEIKQQIESKVNDAKAKVYEAFETIRSDIEEKMTLAKEKISEIIEEIKGFFDFEFTWPKIPMPHFSISPAGWKAADLLEGKIPSLSVEFYAKGGILNDPTIFGLNGNNLMVGGEAGPEAVAPIETLQGYVAAAVASQNVMLVEVLDRIHDAILSLDENMGGHLKDALDDTSLKVNNREFGRLVRGVT